MDKLTDANSEISFSALYEKVENKYVDSNRNWSGMDQTEKWVLLARWFTMEVTGSGVTPIFLYALGEYFSTLLDMLEYAGAVHTSAHLKSIEALYGKGGIPVSAAAREDKFFELEEKRGSQLSSLIDIADDCQLAGEEIVERLLFAKMATDVSRMSTLAEGQSHTSEAKGVSRMAG